MIIKVVKKPIPIETVKVVKENEKEIIELLNKGTTEWNFVDGGFIVHSWEGIDPVFYDVTKNKNSNGKPYWIIKGLKGECYPCCSDDTDDLPLGYEIFVENK